MRKSGDADPSLEHLISYGPPFRQQVLENQGKPGETRGNWDTGKADPRKIKQWRSRLDFVGFGVRRGGFQKIDFLASQIKVKNQSINQTWEAHVAILILKT